MTSVAVTKIRVVLYQAWNENSVDSTNGISQYVNKC